MATDDLEGAFRSKRLWYKRVNKCDDKIRAHIISHLNDPISRRLSGPSLLRPQGDDELEWRMDMTSKSLLGVAILPAAVGASRAATIRSLSLLAAWTWVLEG